MSASLAGGLAALVWTATTTPALALLRGAMVGGGGGGAGAVTVGVRVGRLGTMTLRTARPGVCVCVCVRACAIWNAKMGEFVYCNG